MIQYRALAQHEITRELFRQFTRRQVVTACWRREGDAWVIRDDPFVDDWSESDYQFLVSCLRRTVAGGGLVCAAFSNGALKGFAAVTPEPLGPDQEYLDLAAIHVSQELRGQGIGRALFLTAKQWAGAHGAKKLYISAHSAVESQAFYRSMGCTEAAWQHPEHVAAEPFDCQLECPV